jgi:hypothetical protein
MSTTMLASCGPEAEAAVIQPEIALSVVRPEVESAAVRLEVASAVIQPEVAPTSGLMTEDSSVDRLDIISAVVRPEVSSAVIIPEVASAVMGLEEATAVIIPEVASTVLRPEVSSAVIRPEVESSVFRPEVAAADVRQQVSPVINPYISVQTDSRNVEAKVSSPTPTKIASTKRKMTRLSTPKKNMVSSLGLDLSSSEEESSDEEAAPAKGPGQFEDHLTKPVTTLPAKSEQHYLLMPFTDCPANTNTTWGQCYKTFLSVNYEFS